MLRLVQPPSILATRLSLQRSCPICFSGNAGIYPFQESLHLLYGFHWDQFDPVLKDYCLDLPTRRKSKFLPNFLGDDHLVLGRDGNGGHACLLSIKRSYVINSIDTIYGCQE